MKKFIYTSEEKKINKVLKMNQEQSTELLHDQKMKNVRDNADDTIRKSLELIESMGKSTDVLKNKQEISGNRKLENKPILEPWDKIYDEASAYSPNQIILEDIMTEEEIKKAFLELDEINEKFGYDLQGAFTSAGMDGSSDWRFKTHLANLPIYYEYKDKGINSTDAIEGTYLDNYKQIWDLYITDSTCDPGMLSSKTGDEAESEFGMEEAVFYQNGTWEYNNIKDVGDDNLGILPIYIGVEGEEDQGICTGTENYWCVNSKASEDDIQATLDFMNWCVTSDDGVKAMCKDMGFTIPFKTAQESTNVFVKQDAEYTAAGLTPVSWNFTTMPSEEWKNGLGTALTLYAAGSGSWDDVVSAFVDNWATEKALSE